jgi:hypothetical protein
VVVSAVLALALTGAAGATAACPTSTSATLAGDLGPVGAVGLALRRRGVEVNPSVRCSSLRVMVTRREGGLRVERLDAVGGITARLVTTPDTAAVLIESWLRTDIAAPLLLAEADSVDDADPGLAPAFAPLAPLPTVAPAAPAVAPPVLQTTPARSPASLAPAFALVGEAGLDRGGSRAYGFAVASCVTLGPVCAGLAARWARMSVTGTGDVARDASAAYAADALVAADVPWHLGRATLRPGAAVGAGWIGARGAMLERHDGVLDVVGLRAEARLAMDWRLGKGVAIEVAAAAGAGGSSAVQETMTMMPSRERVALEHGLVPTVRAGLGLRFGSGPP